MFGGPMPMRKMKSVNVAKGTDVQEKAIKQLKKRPAGPMVQHPDMTAKQAREVAPEDLRLGGGGGRSGAK